MAAPVYLQDKDKPGSETVLSWSDGPCHDYCACAHCWRGWTRIPFRTRLRWRIEYLWRVHVVRRQSW